MFGIFGLEDLFILIGSLGFLTVGQSLWSFIPELFIAYAFVVVTLVCCILPFLADYVTKPKPARLQEQAHDTQNHMLAPPPPRSNTTTAELFPSAADIISSVLRPADPHSLVGDQCSICKDDFTRPVRTLCGHTYCEACIRTAFAHRDSCPLCMRKLLGTFNWQCRHASDNVKLRAKVAELQATMQSNADLQTRVTVEVEKRVQNAELRTQNAELRANAAEKRAQDAESDVIQADSSHASDSAKLRARIAELITWENEAELRTVDGEKQVRDAERRTRSAELRSVDGEKQVRNAELRTRSAELRANAAEKRAQDAESALMQASSSHASDNAKLRAKIARLRAKDAESQTFMRGLVDIFGGVTENRDLAVVQ